MPCRVGMTTSLQGLEDRYRKQYSGFKNWETYGPFANRQLAQEMGDLLTRIHGCKPDHRESSEGDPSAPWSVYMFDCEDA